MESRRGILVLIVGMFGISILSDGKALKPSCWRADHFTADPAEITKEQINERVEVGGFVIDVYGEGTSFSLGDEGTATRSARVATVDVKPEYEPHVRNLNHGDCVRVSGVVQEPKYFDDIARLELNEAEML